MRIVVFGSWAPSLIAFRGHLIGELVAAGHDVIGMAAEDDAEVAARLGALGASYQRVSMRRTGMNPAQDLKTLWYLSAAFQRIRPDLVLTYTAKPVIYGLIAAAIAGVPQRAGLITGLGYTFQGRHSLRRRALTRLMRALYRVSLGRATEVLFQNADDRELFNVLGLLRPGTPTQVLPGSGVDVEHYSAPAPAARAQNFLLIARVLREKGIAEYVSAAKIVRRRHPECRFRLLGPIDDHPNAVTLEDLRNWEREGAIEYLGETADVRPYLEDCDVYVLPSYREGMPRSVLEAMAMSRPVITTDAPGCKHSIVDGVHGYIVPPRSAGALASACERFLKRPELVPQMGRQARQRAVDEFDVRKVSEKIMETLGIAPCSPPAARATEAAS